MNQCVPCADDLSANNALEFTPGTSYRSTLTSFLLIFFLRMFVPRRLSPKDLQLCERNARTTYGITNNTGESHILSNLFCTGFPYDGKSCLVNWPPGTPIYECNINCQCDTLCKNRVLQKGVTILMEVYKTKNRGWGARSLEPIPRGKFVCEYTGEVRIGPITFCN